MIAPSLPGALLLLAAVSAATPLAPPAAAKAVTSATPLAQGVLERRARELEAELGVPVTVEAQGVDAPLTSLRIGRPDAPEIAVLDLELLAPVGPEDGPARVERAVALARALRPGAAAGEGGVPVDYAAVIALGPAERDGASLAVARDLNFPTRWLEARARHGDRAGLFPGERVEVARLVDWLLAPRRASCIGAVEIGGAVAPAGDGRWPAGSLGAFMDEGMGRGFAAVPDASRASAAIALLRRGAPEVFVEEIDRRRLGPDTWAVELHISWRRGVEADDPTRRVRVLAEARGAGATPWIGAAARVPGARAYRVLESTGGQGSAQALELPCGGATALRLIVHGGGAEPEISLRLACPGVVAAPLSVSLGPRGVQDEVDATR